jgi:hypothetical protein
MRLALLAAAHGIKMTSLLSTRHGISTSCIATLVCVLAGLPQGLVVFM